MCDKCKDLFYLLTMWLLGVVPLIALAQTGGVNDGGGGQVGGVNNGGDSTVGKSTVLQNPLGNKSLLDFFQELLGAVMVLAVPIIVFFIILAGFKYVTARGNATQVGEAHKALLYAILGGVLVLGAQALLIIIKGTVDSFGS